MKWVARVRGEEIHGLEEMFADWCLAVRSIATDLRPGGRAVFRAPKANYRVEYQWLQTDERDERGKPIFEPKKVTIIPDTGLDVARAYDLTPYAAAFVLAVILPEFYRVPRRRPAAGKPMDFDFYRRLVDAYDQLMLQGHRNPAALLAERMGENRSTARSWIRRGRSYLKEDK